MEKKIEQISNILSRSDDDKEIEKDEDTEAYKLMKKEVEHLKSEYQCKMAKIVERMQAYKQQKAMDSPSVPWTSDEVILPDSVNTPLLPFLSKQSSLEDDVIIPQVKLEVMDSDEEEKSPAKMCTVSNTINSNLPATLSSNNQLLCSTKQVSLLSNRTFTKVGGASHNQKVVPVYIVSMKKKTNVISTTQTNSTDLGKGPDLKKISCAPAKPQILPVYYLSVESVPSGEKRLEKQILLPLCGSGEEHTPGFQVQQNKQIIDQSKITLTPVKGMKSVKTVSSIQICDSKTSAPSSLVSSLSAPTNESSLMENHSNARTYMPRRRKVSTTCCVGCNEENSHRSSLADKTAISLGKNKEMKDNVRINAVASNMNDGILQSQVSCELSLKEVLPQKQLKRLLQSGIKNQYPNKNGLRHHSLPAQLPKASYSCQTKIKVKENFEVEKESTENPETVMPNHVNISSAQGSCVKSGKKRRMSSPDTKCSTFSSGSADSFSNGDLIPASQIKIEINDDEYLRETNNVNIPSLTTQKYVVKKKKVQSTSATNYEFIPPTEIKVEINEEDDRVCNSPEMILSSLSNDDSALGSSSSENHAKDSNSDQDRPNSPKSQMDLLQLKIVCDAYTSERYDEMFEIIECYSFNSEHHNILQKMWNDAHYAVIQNTKNRPLGPVDRYRIRKRFPWPYTIWDGEATIYSFKKKSRMYLIEAFEVDRYPSNEMKVELALKTGLSVNQVSNWFKNKRQRGKESPDCLVLKDEPTSS